MIGLDELERRAMACANSTTKICVVSSVSIVELITRLRQAEKDAARYRWIKENSQLGVGRCGVDWELYFEGPDPDNSGMIEHHIDEAMQCK